jgi:hypothetical protein
LKRRSGKGAHKIVLLIIVLGEDDNVDEGGEKKISNKTVQQ